MGVCVPLWLPTVLVSERERVLCVVSCSDIVFFTKCSATWVAFMQTDIWSIIFGFAAMLLVCTVTTWMATHIWLSLENWAWHWPTYLAPG